jgi:hypothetical protein
VQVPTVQRELVEATPEEVLATGLEEVVLKKPTPDKWLVQI